MGTTKQRRSVNVDEATEAAIEKLAKENDYSFAMFAGRILRDYVARTTQFETREDEGSYGSSPKSISKDEFAHLAQEAKGKVHKKFPAR